ncbi:MAG: cytidylate kinase-like family protein [Oscillospiraceae bacterium]|nr:cytidylate kinase-like family protein [Oscillospiraceae bacterium]
MAQFVISIGREYGSGGHEIGRHLAERLGVDFCDRNMLDRIAEEKDTSAENLRKYDETPKRFLLSRTVRGFSNSPEEIIARMQFEYLEKKAASGESFIVVGRCAESVLKDCRGLISLFITGDEDTKIDRVAEHRNMTRDQARMAILRHDKKRKAYHNYYCEGKWGDSRNYEMTINSSKLGIMGSVDMLENYIRMRIAAL